MFIIVLVRPNLSWVPGLPPAKPGPEDAATLVFTIEYSSVEFRLIRRLAAKFEQDYVLEWRG